MSLIFNTVSRTYFYHGISNSLKYVFTLKLMDLISYIIILLYIFFVLDHCTQFLLDIVFSALAGGNCWIFYYAFKILLGAYIWPYTVISWTPQFFHILCLVQPYCYYIRIHFLCIQHIVLILWFCSLKIFLHYIMEKFKKIS